MTRPSRLARLLDLRRQLFMGSIGAVARLARSKHQVATRRVVRALGGLTVLVNRGKAQTSLDGVSAEWVRMFAPTQRAHHPLVKRDDTTVYHEIITRCPLRGTGDGAACHRMMEYDRRMLETIGGEMVVVSSQAVTGKDRCLVAIRQRGADLSDLRRIAVSQLD